MSFVLVFIQAWKLWKDENSMALVDPAIWDPSLQMEMMRCIHVTLFCVQDSTIDRPIVSTVISMLSSEIADLPTPKQPAFIKREMASYTNLAQQGQIKSSIYNVTITAVYGR